MIIRVSATLKIGRLTKGSHDWPLQVGFEGNKDVQSYFLKLQRDDKLTLDNLLQDVFGAADTQIMPECHLDDAGIFYIKANDKEIIGEIISDIAPEAAYYIVSLVNDSGEAERNGICMWLDASLKNMQPFEGLIKMGYDNNTKLSILACFFQGASGFINKGFYANLPNITLLNFIRFNKIKMKYLIYGARSKEFALYGYIQLNLLKQQLLFQGELNLDDTGYRANVECVCNPKLNPFEEKILNIYFSEIIFHMECNYEKNSNKIEYYLQGNVYFGENKLSGLIYFDEKGIDLAIVSLGTNFSLASLWNNIFTEYVIDEYEYDLCFIEGSELFYCIKDEGFDVGCKYYEKGYGVKIIAELKITKAFMLEGQLYIYDNNITGKMLMLEPIDFGILRLEGYGKNEGDVAGPQLEFSLSKEAGKNKRIFNIKGSVFLFDEKIVGANVQYYNQADGWSIKAEMLPPESLSCIFGKNIITVLYSSKTGFSLENSQGIFQNNALDFLKIFNKYMSNTMGNCKEIKANANGRSTKVEIALKPKLSGCVDRKDELSLCFAGTLRIVGDGNKALLEQELGSDNKLILDKNMQADVLIEELVQMFENITTNLIKNLFSQESFENLYSVMVYVFGDKLKQYMQEILCRKLTDKETAEKIEKKYEEDIKEKVREKEIKERHKGGKGGRGSITNAWVKGGAALFGDDIGTVIVYIAGGIGGLSIVMKLIDIDDDDVIIIDGEPRLACPWFEAKVIPENGEIVLYLEKLKDVLMYEINVIGMYEDENNELKRRDTVIKIQFDQIHKISLLDIPCCNKLYVAARAVHQKQKLSSDWSEAVYVMDVEWKYIINWAFNGGYCIRDCFDTLKNQGFSLTDMQILAYVMQIYGRPETEDEIVAKHFLKEDNAEIAIEHLDKAYPHLSGMELVNHMWYEGYKRREVVDALIWLRPVITSEEAEQIFQNMLARGRRNMEDLNTLLNQIINEKKDKKLTEVEWLSEMALLYVRYEPIDLVIELKNLGFTALQIASALSRIEVVHKAVTVGALLLDPRIYPNTGRSEMKNILQATFPEDDIETALDILYPIVVTVLARDKWYNTKVKLSKEIIVSVEYLDGKWNINPEQPNCDAEGIHIKAKSGYLLPGYNEGCLIGRIENGKVFYVGKGCKLPCEEGILYLVANDDIDSLYGVGFDDNSGEIRVRIKKEYK